MAISPEMYGIPDMDAAASIASISRDSVNRARKLAENYLSMSALKDKTDEMQYAAQRAIDDSTSNASDAINKSNAWAGIANAGLGLLGEMDFGDSAQKTVNAFGNQASGTPGNDFYVGPGGGIFPNPGK